MAQWYHTYLVHPGRDRTIESIKQHFYWHGLTADVDKIVKECPTCQRCKRTNKKYGKLPPKVAETKPWEHLCVDLIGPYTVQREGKKPLKLQCLTMIDPATGWFEIIEYKDKTPNTIANLVEQEWLTRYPNPDIITFDKGKDFIGKAFSNDLIQDEYGIKIQRTTTAN